MITLYGTPKSRALRVSWLLEELSIDWTFSFINFSKGDNRSDSFLALNPSGKIPVITDDDLVLTESAAICQYLAEKYGGGRLLPAAGTASAGHYHQWVSFIICELEQPLWTMGKHKFALPDEQRQSSILPVAKWEFDKAAALAETMIPNTPYLLGDEISVADILLTHTLMWATMFDQDIPPKLASYRDRLQSNPALIRALEKTKAIAAKSE
ncbi:glutathione S-transferase family protein [Shewanella psychrotolerans]|uniref:glutathione S-transferase family protein n=1 Tax=Shewanella psychrotolerans TaxID=2864206 RepID=UPI001C6604D2|nr:glutathione S-transferase family protein [Shewanella psychrotolerans]QYK02277.1 glutathione S-transferase family protein [Shewanella psychrotolerans]